MNGALVAAPEALDAAPSRSIGTRVREFLLVGGLTPFLFLLSWLLRKKLGLDPAEYAVGFLFFYGAWVINDPHFTVTYLLFYRNARARLFGDAFVPAQRVRYAFAGVVVPLALFAWGAIAIATKSAVILGFMIQLMFLLVGWHYVKQGFGVLTVLAARRGVRFDARERIAILAHCYAGWAYAWASPADLGKLVEEKGVVYMTIAHSLLFERITHVILLTTALPMIVLLVKKRLREGRLPLLTPLTALLCSIWPWSIYSSADPLVRYMIPALHSVQYLYFVWLLRGNEAKEREGPPHFERSVGVRLGLLAGSALLLGAILFHFAPALLDGALVSRKAGLTDLGPTPYFAAIFAFINIHHYFMDYVIWRRENPETRYLRHVG